MIVILLAIYDYVEEIPCRWFSRHKMVGEECVRCHNHEKYPPCLFGGPAYFYQDGRPFVFADYVWMFIFLAPPVCVILLIIYMFI